MCDSRIREGRSLGRRLALLGALAMAAALVGCVPYQLRAILDGPKGMALSLSPVSVVVAAASSTTFTADGGVPPYVYSLVSGGGTINASTGVYTAPLVPGSAEVWVTDATGKAAKASITINVYPGVLAVSPAALSLQVGSTLAFTAIGGSPPYTFAIQTAGSGSPTVNASTGFYTAGTTPGTDVVRITDSAASTVTATVTVTNLTSSVDYTIPTVSFPATGTAATAIPGGYNFTLKNSGTAPGTQTVTWKLFLSANTVIDGGDLMIGTGTTTAVAAGSSTSVPIAGAFPAIGPGSWYLIATVEAPDDTTPVNNTSTASAITISAANIDYTVPAAPGVASTGGTTAGLAMTGTLSVSNVGTANGSDTVEWAVYASTDNVLDSADYLLARGTIPGGLTAGASSGTINFNGYWPSTPNAWLLIAQVSSGDDVNPGNDTFVTPATVTVTGPAPANVDYTVPAAPGVTSTGGTTAGDPLTGSFTVHNGGTAPGSQTVYWTAYLSSDATLQIGTDPVIDSGSTGSLGAGATSTAVTFGGTWPPGPGNWFLIVAISSPDDIAPGNNVTASAAAVATTAPSVDYTTQSVLSTGGTTAGSALAGTFVIHNAGTHNGTQFIPWAVYLSTDSTLSIGTDTLVATGSINAPGLTAGANSSGIPFSGTWPAATTVKTWYLIAAVGAGDDLNPANNASGFVSVAVSPPNVDYTVPAVPGVTSTGGTTGGGPLNGSFTISNVGTAGGSATVTWTAYLSPDATLDLTDQPLATGTITQLAAGATSVSIPFSGSWPGGTATWYLIVKVSAPDDVNSANDYRASAPVAVTSSAPVYSINLPLPPPAGTQGGQPVSGSFTIQNISAYPGTVLINWQIYASLGDSVYNVGDVMLASGSTGPIGAGGSASPTWGAAPVAYWPTTPGIYYIIVRAQAADAGPIPDAASALVNVTPPPQDYTVSFGPAIPWSGLVSTAMNLTGTCQITVSNVSASPGHANVTWSVYLSTDNVLDAGDTLIQQGTIAGGLPGLGISTQTFAGNWPAAGGVYYLIASVSATDDYNATNNVVTAQHVVAVGDYRFVEPATGNNTGGSDSNRGVGPTPPPAQTSNTGVAALAAGQTIVIEGTMDVYNQYDTYQFATGASMSRLSIQARWSTGFDDIDLYLWDTGATNLSSLTTGIDAEPGASTWDITSVTPRTCYVSANFYLDANTSGDAGKPYVIVVLGKP